MWRKIGIKSKKPKWAFVASKQWRTKIFHPTTLCPQNSSQQEKEKAANRVCLTVLHRVCDSCCACITPYVCSCLLAHPIEPVTFQSCTCTKGAFARIIGAPVFRTPAGSPQGTRDRTTNLPITGWPLCQVRPSSVCVCLFLIVCARTHKPPLWL